jgi:hypothetical protein
MSQTRWLTTAMGTSIVEVPFDILTEEVEMLQNYADDGFCVGAFRTSSFTEYESVPISLGILTVDVTNPGTIGFPIDKDYHHNPAAWVGLVTIFVLSIAAAFASMAGLVSLQLVGSGATGRTGKKIK